MSDLRRIEPLLVRYRNLRRLDSSAEVPGAAALAKILGQIERLQGLPVECFVTEVEALHQSKRDVCICVARYCIDGLGRVHSEEVARGLRLLSERIDEPLIGIVSDVKHDIASFMSGSDQRGALEGLEDARRGVRCLESTPVSRWLDAWLCQWLGYLLQRSGQFGRALTVLEEAVALSESHDLCTVWSAKRTLAGLFLASGQPREALRTYASDEWRSEARADGDVLALLDSHIMAAESAICLGVAAKANFELGEALDIVREHEGQFPQWEAELVLRSAKLDTLWGNVDEGVHLFEHAIELFEALDPPCSTGILDAKIELIEFALRKQDYDTVFERLGQLLEEAEERGCIDARSRLLAFHARLFIDDMAPAEKLQAGYDDLVTRLHLMNNPRLTFLAYADLYAYARKRLDNREQQFWLMRLRGLQRLLDRSCYQDLYGQYVLERYRHEIESGLMSLDPEFREEFDEDDDDD